MPPSPLNGLINNAIYSEKEVPTVVNLNDAEEWHLIVGASITAEPKATLSTSTSTPSR